VYLFLASQEKESMKGPIMYS